MTSSTSENQKHEERKNISPATEVKPLSGKIAVVTGASRGTGKGIAMALGEAGATVYVTGRTAKPDQAPILMGEKLPGTIAETAAEVNRLGGKGIAVTCDHRNDKEVEALFKRIKTEQGTLDILVNNAFLMGDDTTSGKGFWEVSIDNWDNQQMVGLRSAYVASVYAAQIMVPNKKGAIFNISAPSGGGYVFSVAYGVIKAALDRLSSDMAHELRPHNIASISIWLGPVFTELIMIMSRKYHVPFHEDAQESQLYGGRAIVALAADPAIMEKSGRTMISTDIAQEYGFTDTNGKQPTRVQDLFWPPPPPPIYR